LMVKVPLGVRAMARSGDDDLEEGDGEDCLLRTILCQGRVVVFFVVAEERYCCYGAWRWDRGSVKWGEYVCSDRMWRVVAAFVDEVRRFWGGTFTCQLLRFVAFC